MQVVVLEAVVTLAFTTVDLDTMVQVTHMMLLQFQVVILVLLGQLLLLQIEAQAQVVSTRIKAQTHTLAQQVLLLLSMLDSKKEQAEIHAQHVLAQ